MTPSGEIPPVLERYRSGGISDRAYRDLHDHVLALHRAGLMRVVDEPINKDTEMHPLVRWQVPRRYCGAGSAGIPVHATDRR